MSISYHGVIGHKSRVTLPSVDTWGNNMNLLRDPPRSIQTRKIDKVGETSEITQMIQESGDRACEAIMTYARGVNPMVSVSYNNYGNNGGQTIRSSIVGGATPSDGAARGSGQAYLPYRIMNGGAFRPPVRDQRDLLPLSRLPRVWTSSYTQPGFADFSKKAMCPGTDLDTKGVKTPSEMLKGCVRPTATYKIETPVVEPYEVKNVIKNPTLISGFSGLKANKQVNLLLTETPGKEVVNNPLHVNAQANQVSEITRNAENYLDTEQYVHETLKGSHGSNTSHNVQITPLDQLVSVNMEGKIKEQINIPYTVHSKPYTKQEYIHEDVTLQRTLPYYEGRTNIGQNIYHRVVDGHQEREYMPNRPVAQARTNIGVNNISSIDNITNRSYNLKPTVNPGGYEPNYGQPAITRQEITEFDNEKTKMRQRIYDMQSGRHETYNPYATAN